MEFSTGAIGVDADAGPKGFVDLHGIFMEFYKTLAFTDTHFAELAGGGNIKLSVFICNSIKGAQTYQIGGFFVCDQLLVDDKLSHKKTSL